MSTDINELYPSNSKPDRPKPVKKKPPEREIKQIVDSSAVKVRRKSGIARLAKSIFAGDAKSISEYLMDDVVIPKLQDILLDTINKGGEYLIYGETKASRLGGNRRSSIYYSGVGGREADRKLDRIERYGTLETKEIGGSNNQNYDVDYYSDLVFRDRQQAEEILSRMYEDLQDYGCCTILSLKSMMGHHTTHTDEKYGWEDLTGSRIKKVRGGWLLELPRATYLD